MYVNLAVKVENFVLVESFGPCTCLLFNHVLFFTEIDIL